MLSPPMLSSSSDKASSSEGLSGDGDDALEVLEPKRLITSEAVAISTWPDEAAAAPVSSSYAAKFIKTTKKKGKTKQKKREK